jgi:hypothetical protein
MASSTYSLDGPEWTQDTSARHLASAPCGVAEVGARCAIRAGCRLMSRSASTTAFAALQSLASGTVYEHFNWEGVIDHVGAVVLIVSVRLH